ncbi:hypothetical protein [Streptomyces sp. CC77]|uniref:hypothetical protein n=1 Tax=Streptomyces sp. CC77 TaxID=1906739 RepID=UPI00158747C8|nr:hypothetical protein [Streptomyces sp. CC77]
MSRGAAGGVTYHADPHHTEPHRTNRLRGARGAHVDDPDGHHVELLPRPHTRPA